VVYPPIADRFAGGSGPAFRKRHGIPPDAPLVLAVGSITERRGQAVLVEAIRRVRDELPAICAIVGDPFPRAPDLDFDRRLRVLAAGLGEGVAYMVGYEPRIADAYAAADVVVNPSTGPEAFGRVACEALAAGRPVVATRTGATPEVLRDGETALLVAPGDPHAMADAIAGLLADPASALHMAERGRADVLRRFPPDAARERFSAGIAAALAERAP
jgi:glycosyltransferase involved in cell wall biosynthesis